MEIGTAMSAEFTKGEMKVLRCLVRGLSYNEIAKELGIEPSTHPP
ncbi:MAG: LuxR C-terminal-related transcriptional regulator [Subdoligranulum variabile]|nr:LuxR C-terminal-related transcriptional regulator [Subdoligranulum variabile]